MSIRSNVLDKINTGVLRQALTSRDFTDEEISYIIMKVER
jgi:hypothetical protein